MGNRRIIRLWRLDRLAYSFIGIQIVILVLGIFFVLHLLNSAEDKLSKTHTHAISTLDNTHELLETSFPLALALNTLALEAQTFHRDMELLALDPDHSHNNILENIQQLKASLDQIKALTQNNLDEMLEEAVEVLIDIGYEARITASGNEMLRLYRDTLDPMQKVMTAIQSSGKSTVQKNRSLSHKLSQEAKEVQTSLLAAGSFFEDPRLQISLLIGLLLILPSGLFLLFIYQIYRRLSLLEN